MRFAKIMLCPFKTESRSKRECSIVYELGHDVTIINVFDNKDVVPKNYFHLSRDEVFNGGLLKRFPKFLKWALWLRRYDFDVISAYDISALFIVWISNVLKPKSRRAKLVYDAHEFEYGRTSDRSKLATRFVLLLEKFLMKRVAGSIMVNESIATEVKKLHNLNYLPTFVRSMSNYVAIDETVLKHNKIKILEKLRVNSDSKILMYHGGIVKGRGIEQLIRIINRLDNTILIILGSGEPSYIDLLKGLIYSKKVENYVHFHQAVPSEELWKFVGIADLGFVILENLNLNHFYTLPNKLFENIQAGTVVVGADYPELKKIIEVYEIGEVCDVSSDENLLDTVKNLLNDKDKLAFYRSNIIKNKHVLSWDYEKYKLIDFYKNIFKCIKVNQ